MQVINIHEAKTHLSRLATSAANGEPFIIAKSGKPLVQVVPYTEQQKKPKRIGFMNISVPDNFNQLFSDEIENLFSGVGE